MTESTPLPESVVSRLDTAVRDACPYPVQAVYVLGSHLDGRGRPVRIDLAVAVDTETLDDREAAASRLHRQIGEALDLTVYPHLLTVAELETHRDVPGSLAAEIAHHGTPLDDLVPAPSRRSPPGRRLG